MYVADAQERHAIVDVQNIYIPRIVAKLKSLHPYKIILFGSYAYGNPSYNSDIDLLVVLDIEKTPQGFHENMQNKLLVRNALLEFAERVPIDLIVHTKPMYRKFNALDSMFAKEIRQRGKILYEASHA